MGVTSKTREKVISRDTGCFRCGGTANNVHHRMARGSGGSKLPHVNAAANLLLMCGSGTTGCHGWVETNRAIAYEQGLLVRRNGVMLPSGVPVFSLWRNNWFFLDDFGGCAVTSPPLI